MEQSNLFQDLNHNKSPGTDNPETMIPKALAYEVTRLPLLIYKKSLETGEVPADWRTVNITPVSKNGQKYQTEIDQFHSFVFVGR